MIAVLAFVTRAVALAAIVAMTGAIAFRWGVLRRWPATSPAPLGEWSASVARAGAWAAVCIVLIAPLRLYAQAHGLVMAGDPVLPMMSNVIQTMWGRGWILQCGAALAMLAALLWAGRGSPRGWRLALVSAIAITSSPALMGHAIAAERLLVLSMLADWLHVSMAGAWLGTLAMLALVAQRAATGAAGGDPPVATLIELFHPVALTCSLALVVTGVVSVLLRVDRLGDLLHSRYGAILAVKLLLTFCVAALGLHHSRRGAQLARRGETRGVVRSLASEVALAVMVIAATAVLVATEPPMHDDSMQMHASAWRGSGPAR